MAALAMLVSLAFASHPGHGTTSPDSWLHYLTEPGHVGVIVGCGVAAVVGVLWLVFARPRSER